MAAIRLDDSTQTLVLAPGPGLPSIAYWGPQLPESEDLDALQAALQADLNSGMMDALAPLTICPVADGLWQGAPALELFGTDGGPLAVRFGPASVVSDGSTVNVTALDRSLDLTYRATIRFTPSGALELRASIETEAPVVLRWLSAPVLPVPAGLCDVLEFSGKWIGEFQTRRLPFASGARLSEGRAGRSGHEAPPFAYLMGPGTTNTAGPAVALAYGWPGGHRMIAEELPCGRRLIQFGNAANAERSAATRFSTATLTIKRSDQGLNGAATHMQAHVRDTLSPIPAAPRPVHYNSWEAVYFDHNLLTLTDLAERAARIGAERFVLDDGWFGQRNDATTSLGDWIVDTKKWPNGLSPLIDVVRNLGMGFGIWIEPEMISVESTLFRTHPDWVLGPADQVKGRQQLVLDVGKEQVRDHLFDRISSLLTDHSIEYLKWDHNRLLPVSDTSQARGLLDLLHRVRGAHPEVEIESCAAGGGRIDYGILEETSRVWLSDCNDPLERLRIQHAAALVLPATVTGSHVGPRQSHTTGRILPMSIRAWIAAQRHMGFEMDLRELTEDEEAVLTRVTAWYKANRDWMLAGAIHRLDSDDPAVTAEQQMAADGSRFTVFATQAKTSEQGLPRTLRLTALDPRATYRVTLANPEDVPPQSLGSVALKSGAVTLSGRALMSLGLTLPIAWPQTIYVLEGRRL